VLGDLGKGFLKGRLGEGFGHCKRPWTCPGFARRVGSTGKVFDLELPLADVAEGYRAMDERRAIKTLLRV